MKDIRELLERLRKVSDIHINNHGGAWPITDQISHVHSEVSEVYDVIRRPQKYIDKGLDPTTEFRKEVIDIVYSALTLLNLGNYDNESILNTFEEVMQKIEIRVGLR